MRIYINRKPVDKPWGGGNKMLRAVRDALVDAGHEVVHHLMPDIDVLFCFDPRPGSESGLHGYQEIYQYSRGNTRHADDNRPEPTIVQRVGDVGTHGKPELTHTVMNTVCASNVVVYPSQWAYDYIAYALQIQGRAYPPEWHVIQNAPHASFYKHRRSGPIKSKKIRLVSHHWSDNPKKGFDFYARLDGDLGALLDVEFTYIGRTPAGVRYRSQLGPYTDTQIAEELPKHDVYVTASLEEAGANHVLEALACGLPVIYHQSGGSINEYCCSYGVPFDGTIDSFQAALDHIIGSYDRFENSLRTYRRKVDDVALQYVSLIERTRDEHVRRQMA